MYINKTILYGNLTRDPELKSLPAGIVVVNFSVATNRTWKDKSGQNQDEVEYHNVVAFGRTAETINQYMKKGSGIYVEGRIRTRNWEGADGKKNYRTEIIAERIQFGPRSTGGSSGASPVAQTPKGDSKPDPLPDESVGASDSEGIDYPEENVNVDDIPF